MTKTLVINYTPRNGSYTQILRDEFVKLAKSKTEMTYLDLAKTPPDLLVAENLNLVMDWNQGKRDFSDLELTVLANHHKLIDQVLENDHIVLACPIYNFSIPAAVKAWIDAVVVSDKTFYFNPETGFKGLCTDKKVVSIMVSGFDYTQSLEVKEYASSTLKQNFDFMGMASQQISAYGVDQNRDQLDSILGNAKQEIKTVVEEWYPN